MKDDMSKLQKEMIDALTASFVNQIHALMLLSDGKSGFVASCILSTLGFASVGLMSHMEGINNPFDILEMQHAKNKQMLTELLRKK
jgi:hypothetical protein